MVSENGRSKTEWRPLDAVNCRKALFPDKSMSGIDIEKVKEELLHDKNFLLQIESSMKRMDEKTVCEPREDGGMEESESGLDMDVDMMLDGLEMFEMGV